MDAHCLAWRGRGGDDGLGREVEGDAEDVSVFDVEQVVVIQLVGLAPKGTADNLLAAAEGEKEEWGTLYPDFAAVADEEGFEDVAVSFREIAEVEEQHELRYRKLLANVENGRVFKRDTVVKWHCRNCGYIHEGTEAPDECPACKHAQAYYELWVEAY